MLFLACFSNPRSQAVRFLGSFDRLNPGIELNLSSAEESTWDTCCLQNENTHKSMRSKAFLATKEIERKDIWRRTTSTFRSLESALTDQKKFVLNFLVPIEHFLSSLTKSFGIVAKFEVFWENVKPDQNIREPKITTLSSKADSTIFLELRSQLEWAIIRSIW